jgi:hypothetical protein
MEVTLRLETLSLRSQVHPVRAKELAFRLYRLVTRDDEEQDMHIEKFDEAWAPSTVTGAEGAYHQDFCQLRSRLMLVLRKA